MASEWVKLTEQDSKEPAIWGGVTNARILEEHKGETRGWFLVNSKKTPVST